MFNYTSAPGKGNKKKNRQPAPPFTPCKNGTRAYSVKGKKPAGKIVSSAATHWLGHKIFALAGRNGINLSAHINAEGKMSRQLAALLNYAFKGLIAEHVFNSVPAKKSKKALQNLASSKDLKKLLVGIEPKKKQKKTTTLKPAKRKGVQQVQKFLNAKE